MVLCSVEFYVMNQLPYVATSDSQMVNSVDQRALLSNFDRTFILNIHMESNRYIEALCIRNNVYIYGFETQIWLKWIALPLN